MTNKRRAKLIIEKDENSFSENNEEDKLITLIAQLIVSDIMNEEDEDLPDDAT